MAQSNAAVIFVQTTICFKDCSFHAFYSRPKLPIHYSNKPCLYIGKYANYQGNKGFSFPWLGSSKVSSDVAKSSCKANVFDREERFPPIQTLRSFPMEELSEKAVMVRFDSSILLDPSFSIASNAINTIIYLYEAGAKVILTSSWNVKCNANILSEEAVAEHFSSVLQLKVVRSTWFSAHQQLKVKQYEEAKIVLYENLFNYKQELANDSEFARALTSGVDIFVNDSFSTAHKILASTVGVTQFCYACLAGFHLEECLFNLKKISECDQSPSVVVVGGGNIKDKAGALHVLASKRDGLVFVGMMAFQIMHAMGMPVPLYLVEQGGAKEALEFVKYAKGRGIPILFPCDFLCKHSHLQMELKSFPAQSILDEFAKGWKPVDLGPNSFIDIASFLSRSKNIIWIGPVKVGQSNEYSDGSSKLAHILDEVSENGCHVTVIGHMACETVLQIPRLSYACTMIEHASVVWEYLKGRNLPGLLALDRAYASEIQWNMIYSDPTQSLAVDIGSGNGLFLTGMANMRKDMNFLGLEINDKLVTRCLESTVDSRLKNLHFIATNATSSFRTIVSSYPGQLVLVSIQCPNPDFNRLEYRWRMVQRSLIEAIADELVPGGKVFLQSDVKEVAMRMREQFLNEGKRKLAIVSNDKHMMAGPEGWLEENPFGIRSDWERHVLARKAPMYRLMLYKR